MGYWKSHDFVSVLIAPLIAVAITFGLQIVQSIVLPKTTIEYGTVVAKDSTYTNIIIKNPSANPVNITLAIAGRNPVIVASSGIADINLTKRAGRDYPLLELSGIPANAFEMILIKDDIDINHGVYVISSIYNYEIVRMDNRYVSWLTLSAIIDNSITFIIILLSSIYIRGQSIELRNSIEQNRSEMNILKAKSDEMRSIHEKHQTSIDIRLARIKMYSGKLLGIYAKENMFWRNCFEKILFREGVGRHKVLEFFALMDRHLGFKRKEDIDEPEDATIALDILIDELKDARIREILGRE